MNSLQKISTFGPLLGIVSLLTISCSSTPEKGVGRQPANASMEWALSSINLHTEVLTGHCDLTPSRLLQHSRSSPQTVFFEGLLRGRTGRNDGCQLTSNRFGPDGTGVIISGNYSPQVPERMTVTVKIGDLLIVDNHDDDRSLSERKFEDIESNEHGTIKFRADATAELVALCSPVTAKGLWGFGSRQVTCSFTGGAGSVKLKEQ
ncbi:MAG: hypothetical protein IPJ84_09530 [Bdellovibrionales bacterium]|nr:hypothetical protein [Bdellovibrionales bacterium]